MKTFFTLLTLLAVAAIANATDYTGTLNTTVNGSTSTQPTTITIDENADGTYNLSLKNFVFSAGGNDMPVGNIILNNVEGTTEDGMTVISCKRNINIEKGDLPGYSLWMGPILGSVPIEMEARFNDAHLETTIDINLSLLSQVIHVEFDGNNTTNIKSIKATRDSKEEIFSLDGKRIKEPINKKQVYIIKKANGETIKSIGK